MRFLNSLTTIACAGVLLAACREAPTTARTPAPSFSTFGSGAALVVNISRDTTAQNETPIAVNPANTSNMITGNNDWNYNDGCGVNATFDGGKAWTPTLPNGFIPGITAFTNDPSVPGTGIYDFGGDPAVAFSPDGNTAYFTCFGYRGKAVALWLSRSSDGGRSWTAGGADHPLTLVSAYGKWQGTRLERPIPRSRVHSRRTRRHDLRPVGALRRLQLALAHLHRRVEGRRRKLRHSRQGHEWIGPQRSGRARRHRSRDRIRLPDLRQFDSGRKRHG